MLTQVRMTLNQRAETLLKRAWRLAEHELDACEGHLLALREHWRLARRARRASELVRDQFDLLPATQSRLASDHRQRLALLRQLWSGPDLSP
jgi:hypothetical protein